MPTTKKTPQPANSANGSTEKRQVPAGKRPEQVVAGLFKAAKSVVPALSDREFLELVGTREPVEINLNRRIRLPELAAAAEALRAAATAAIEPYLGDAREYICEVRFDHRDEIAVEFRSNSGLDVTLHFPPTLSNAKAAAVPGAKPAKKAAAKAGA